jgi:hypothetical protein
MFEAESQRLCCDVRTDHAQAQPYVRTVVLRNRSYFCHYQPRRICAGGVKAALELLKMFAKHIPVDSSPENGSLLSVDLEIHVLQGTVLIEDCVWTR